VESTRDKLKMGFLMEKANSFIRMVIIIKAGSPMVSKTETVFILFLTLMYIADSFSKILCGVMEFLNLQMVTHTKGILLIVYDAGRENTYQDSLINKEYYFLKESTKMTLKTVLE
jgi:hypothetical protein